MVIRSLDLFCLLCSLVTKLQFQAAAALRWRCHPQLCPSSVVRLLLPAVRRSQAFASSVALEQACCIQP